MTDSYQTPDKESWLPFIFAPTSLMKGLLLAFFFGLPRGERSATEEHAGKTAKASASARFTGFFGEMTGFLCYLPDREIVEVYYPSAKVANWLLHCETPFHKL